MCFLFHDWKWDPPVSLQTRSGVIQYATCSRCGKTKAREILV